MEVTLKLDIDLRRFLKPATLDLHADGIYNFDDYYEEHLKENLEDLILRALTPQMVEKCVSDTFRDTKDYFEKMEIS
jgi:hypothetical protein